ncbi:MAG: sporulation protein [Clostridia bacterium]|nr:sporulation protein [Clostridia bacterium]
MNRLRRWVGKASEKMGVPPQIASLEPRITMLGINELVIENHKGLIEYSPEVVRIKTSLGVIAVDGSGMLLDLMNSDTVAISGKIYHVMTIK